jgi:N utilization substance protein A
MYEGRDGDLVTGIVQQSDHRTVILDLGNAEAVMPFGEKIPTSAWSVAPGSRP